MKKAIIITAALVIFLAGFSLVGAQSAPNAIVNGTFSLKSLKVDGQNQHLDSKDGSSPVSNLILAAIDMLLKVIGSLALLVVIISGIFMITSRGEEAQITKGKKIFTYALLGLAITFASYIIVTIIQSVLK